MGGPQGQVDFFISYTAADRSWAEWIAWQLESERYTTVLQAWDFAPGENFVVRMRDALEQADRTIAVVSEAYLVSRYSTDEWTGAFLDDESGQERLVSVPVEACALPRLLATRIYIDLAGTSRPTAKQRLLEGVKRGRRRPDREPPGPWGTTGAAAQGAGRAAVSCTGAKHHQPAQAQPQLHWPNRTAGGPASHPAVECWFRDDPDRGDRGHLWPWGGSARPSWPWSMPTAMPATTT
jgi:hypothetical protein